MATAEATGRILNWLLPWSMPMLTFGVIAAGKLLSLSAQGRGVGLAGAILADYEEVLDYIGYPEANLIFPPTTAEKIARFITNPVVAFFSPGFTGLVLELYTAGWGILEP